ncbi:DUF7507 domain-containing protein [Flavobacterium sp. RSSB_23]|uniref:DUF7507 domain-containing protein n=1 Tax=Flavobacterium sp. RSSB_23 TaxID=3447668 RepID=UPI003F32EF7B
MKKVLLFLVLFFIFSYSNAATFTSVASGDWNSDATWSGTGIPGVNDIVIINSNFVITVSSPTVTCQSIEFSGNGILRVNSGSTLNVITSLIVDSSNSSNRTTAIQGAGTLNSSSVQVGTNATPTNNFATVLISTISNLNISGNLGLVSRRAASLNNNASFRLESGVVDIDGQITTTNQSSGVTSTFTMASGAQTGVLLLSNANPFNLSTNTTNTIVLNGASTTVNYNGLAQSVLATTYTNLSLSGSGTKTFLSSTLITNALSIATGVKANLGTFTHTARSINLGGTIATAQTWGSSASTATNKNDVFFESSTGLVLIIREVNRIYTDYNGFFTSAGTTSDPTKQPDTENNLLAFEWNGKTWATGVDNAVLTSNGVAFEDTKFRALKIFDIQYTTSTYFLQGAAIDGSLTNRVLTPALIGSTSTPAELAERLTDGKRGLSLGTGIANIKAGTSEFKIGTGNINISGVGDGKPDIIITQVAQPNSVADVFKFVDVNGNTIGNPITISFPSINAVGTYRLDLFNAADGSTTNSFTPNETRDIRMLGYDFSDFGINASNEALVDRLVITFSGSSDCAFIGVNEGSLKRSELSLIKTASIIDCGKIGDTVTYTFEVKNTGDVPINKIKVFDLNPAVSIPSNSIALLMPGASATVTGTYVITAADAAIGKIENSAEVEGEDPSFFKITDISGTNEFNNVPTVINLLDPPTIGAISNVTCAAVTSGTVVLSNLPPTGNWMISSTPTVMGLSGASGSGTSTIISGLPIGNYTFRVTSASGCISPNSANVAILDASSATWNGTAWVGGITPDATRNAIINGPFTISSNLTACSLTINTGVVVTVASGVTLTITNAVTTNGQLIFENNASLVQTTNATNTGAIEYRRISSPMKNFDYTYWSSPVTGQNIVALSPNTLADKYFRFDGSTDNWEFYNGTMVPGVGYIIRTPKEGNPWPNGEIVSFPYSQPVAFKGVPNNGNYPFAVGANELNLIGNPYPSAISADDFITANASIIYGALYFWTHNTAIAPSGSDYVYTANDYATYNITGGTAGGPLPIPLTGPAQSPGLNTSVPDGFIAAGQSFFVENSIAGNFQFTNAMRVAGNNSQFFKQANTKKAATIEKNRVWLNLTNSSGAFKQLLVGYITGATNDWDNLYDGPTFDGQEFVDFYSVNQGKNLTIQGRALPFVDTDVVPLGYRSTIAGSFDISIDNRDGALAGQEIWLEDKKTNTLHELSKGNYTFTAINGVENDRFVLKYTNKTLGTDDNEVADNSLIVSVKNKKITLTSSAEAITQVQIFDLLGRKVYDKSKINAQEWSISNLSSSEQTLIVKTTLANGAISNKKIIY